MRSIQETVLEDLGKSYSFTLSLTQKHAEIPATDFEVGKDEYVELITTLIGKDSQALREFVEKAWDAWQIVQKRVLTTPKLIKVGLKHLTTEDARKSTVPFRFIDEKHPVKIMRLVAAEMGIESRKIVGGVKFVVGDGLGRNGSRGYKFEKDLVGTLQSWVLSGFLIDSSWNPDLRATIENIRNSELRKIIEDYVTSGYGSEEWKIPELRDESRLRRLVSSVVVHGNQMYIDTGKKNTQRPFPLMMNDEDGSILRKSGGVISDITLVGPNKELTFLSVKQSRGQLTGSVVSRYVAGGNRWMDVVLGGLEDVDGESRAQFDEFFKTVGIDPGDVVDKFAGGQPVSGQNLRVWKGYDAKKTARLFQSLVGGGYWYVNPKLCVWVPDKPTNKEFRMTKAPIITGTGIKVVGEIGGVPCYFELRTDKHQKFPIRLFPGTRDIEGLIRVFGS